MAGSRIWSDLGLRWSQTLDRRWTSTHFSWQTRALNLQWAQFCDPLGAWLLVRCVLIQLWALSMKDPLQSHDCVGGSTL